MNKILIGGLVIVVGGALLIFLNATPAAEGPGPTSATPETSAPVVETVVESVTDETASENEADEVAVSFDVDSFNYGFSPEEIRVKEGDLVTINLTNSDGFHDWVVDEFGAATEKITAGDTTSVTFVASKKGTYEYYCSVGSHRAQGMVGTLIVE